MGKIGYWVALEGVIFLHGFWDDGLMEKWASFHRYYLPAGKQAKPHNLAIFHPYILQKEHSGVAFRLETQIHHRVKIPRRFDEISWFRNTVTVLIDRRSVGIVKFIQDIVENELNRI